MFEASIFTTSEQSKKIINKYKDEFEDIDKELIIEKIIEDILKETKHKDILIEEKIKVINKLNKVNKIPIRKACEIFGINERTYRRKKKMSV